MCGVNVRQIRAVFCPVTGCGMYVLVFHVRPIINQMFMKFIGPKTYDMVAGADVIFPMMKRVVNLNKFGKVEFLPRCIVSTCVLCILAF